LVLGACSGELAPSSSSQDLHYSQLEVQENNPRLELSVQNVYGGTDKLEGRVDSEGQVVFQGDMIIGFKANLETQAAGVRSRKWPNNTVPFTVNRTIMPPEQQDQIDRAVRYFNDNTNLNWVEVFENEGQNDPNDEDPHALYGNFLEIRYSGMGVCNSFVGMIEGTIAGSPQGGQPLNFAKWCGYRGILHEMGHVIGLHHEHVRRDRDDYINLNCGYLACWDPAWAIKQEAEPFGSYDYYSIMHYSAYVDTDRDGAIDAGDLQVLYPLKPGIEAMRIGQEEKLSGEDIRAINELYSEAVEPTSPEDPPEPEDPTDPDDPNPDDPEGPPESNSFRSSLKAHHSDLCLDVPGWLIDHDTQLMQWDCHLRNNQIFDFEKIAGTDNIYTIRSSASTKCLTIKEMSHIDGAKLIQAECTGAPNQEFRLRVKPVGYFQVVANHSNKCISVTDANTRNGGKLSQQYCYWRENDIANQVFYISMPTSH